MYYGAKAAKNDNELSLAKMLQYAIEDEYLAREEYDIAIKTLGDEKPFPGIINSEVAHINWLKDLHEKYGLQIPQNEAINFIEAPKSINEALEFGITAEIENIEMYDTFLKECISDDVKVVFTKLRDASRGHLFVLKKRLAEI